MDAVSPSLSVGRGLSAAPRLVESALMSARESGESGSLLVMIWLLSKYRVILTLALSLLAEQREGSFLATKPGFSNNTGEKQPPGNTAPGGRRGRMESALQHLPWAQK